MNTKGTPPAGARGGNGKGETNMKKLAVCLVALCLLLSAAWAEDGTWESAGYASPEEAVLAYGEAFAKGDVMEMISTFAVESYVDHMDSKEYMLYYRTYATTRSDAMLPLPYTEGYARQLRVLDRVSSLLNSLKQQYFAMSGMQTAEADYAKAGTGMILFSADNADMADAFLDAAKDTVWPGDVAVGPVLGRDVSAQIDWGQSYDKNVASLCAYAGGDEAVTVAVTLRIDGVDYLQLMLCVRYGDTWYNQALGGFAANYITARFNVLSDFQYACGLIPADAAMELLAQLSQ